jgi:hypothetical protein
VWCQLTPLEKEDCEDSESISGCQRFRKRKEQLKGVKNCRAVGCWLLTHACNCSYGDRDQENQGLKAVQANSLRDSTLKKLIIKKQNKTKKACGVAQGLGPSTTKKKKKKKKEF